MSERRESLIEHTFRFVSWLRKNFPETKDRLLNESFDNSYAEYIRGTCLSFWLDLGKLPPTLLLEKSKYNESIVERIAKLANDANEEIKYLIFFGFIDSHLKFHDYSPIGDILGKATGYDLVTWYEKGLFGKPPKYQQRPSIAFVNAQMLLEYKQNKQNKENE